MTVLAGQMTQTPTGNPEWKLCDGSIVYVNELIRVGGVPYPPRPHSGISMGTRWDYVNRVGRWHGKTGLGPNYFWFRLPYDPSGTWYVKTMDDTSDPTLTNPPTVMHPPPGVK